MLQPPFNSNFLHLHMDTELDPAVLTLYMALVLLICLEISPMVTHPLGTSKDLCSEKLFKGV